MNNESNFNKASHFQALHYPKIDDLVIFDFFYSPHQFTQQQKWHFFQEKHEQVLRAVINKALNEYTRSDNSAKAYIDGFTDGLALYTAQIAFINSPTDPTMDQELKEIADEAEENNN